MFVVRNLSNKAIDYKTVSEIEERRLILCKKKLCFNSTATIHRASEYLSIRWCVKCKRKHHSSICDNTTINLLTTCSCSVTYPVVLIEIEGFKCRTVIDNGAGASCNSSTLINHINKKPIRTETKKIETLMSTNIRNIKINSVRIQNITCEFDFETGLNHLEKELL